MGLNHHLPLHTPDCSHTKRIIIIKGKKDNDIFISIVNKLEHKYTKFHVMSSVVEVFPPQGKATNLNSGNTIQFYKGISVHDSVYIYLCVI